MKENAFNIPTFLEFGACHVTGKNWVGGGVALMIWPIRGCASPCRNSVHLKYTLYR